MIKKSESFKKLLEKTYPLSEDKVNSYHESLPDLEDIQQFYKDLSNDFRIFQFIQGMHNMEIENKIYKKNQIISKLNVEKSRLKKLAISYALMNNKKD